MAQAGRPRPDEKPPPNLRLLVRRQYTNSRLRREGSLAAALIQSMALAVISTAGAYPSWVLVSNSMLDEQVVLGASWAINRDDPPGNSPLLGSAGDTLLLAIAACCLLSVVTGSSAIAWDFLGQRHCRRLGPMLHCLTAFLISCAAAFGSSLLVVVRGQVRTVPELQRRKFAATPGQSLFLSFLACALTATATGFSCSSPALVSASRSSRDVGRSLRRRVSVRGANEEAPPSASSRYYSWQDEIFFDLETTSCSQEDEAAGPADWYSYLKRELTPRASWKERWWGRRSPQQQQQQQQQPAPGEEEEHHSGQRQEPAAQEEERAPPEKPRREPKPLPQRGIHRELSPLSSPPQIMEEDAVHLRQQGEKESDQEDPGRGDAELQLSLGSESHRVKSGEKTSQTSESQAAEAGLVESQDWEKQDPATIAI